MPFLHVLIMHPLFHKPLGGGGKERDVGLKSVTTTAGPVYGNPEVGILVLVISDQYLLIQPTVSLRSKVLKRPF